MPSGLTRGILAGALLTGMTFWMGFVVVVAVAVAEDDMVGFGVEDSLVGVLVAVAVVFEVAVDADLFVEDMGIVFLVPIGVRTGLATSVVVVAGFTGVAVDSLDSFPVA